MLVDPNKAFINLEALKKKIETEGKMILRPSMLQQFLGCPAQWFRAGLLNDYQKPAAAATAGTSLHKGAEVGYTDKIKHGSLPPISYLTDVVVEEWRDLNEKQELEFGKDEDYHTYERDLVKGITEYHSSVMPISDPIAVEKRYDIMIEDHPIFKGVGGTLDLVFEEGVGDIKFTKKKTTPGKYMLQQSTYALLRQKHGETCNFNQIHNVIRGKGAEILALRMNTAYAESVIRRILHVTKVFWETGETELFRGTNMHAYYLCSPTWCGYWDTCPYVKELRQ